MQQLINTRSDLDAAGSLLALVLNLLHAMAVQVVAASLAVCAFGSAGLPSLAGASVFQTRRMPGNKEQLLVRVERQRVERRRVWVVRQRRRRALHPRPLCLPSLSLFRRFIRLEENRGPIRNFIP